MADPEISIITVNLNNSEGLLRTIESVIQQTSRNFEFIVIDGDSSDVSKEVITRYQDEFKFWVSEKDTGIYNAMNKGIRNSSGEYLLFLNSGDWLYDDKVIEKVLPLMHTYDVISGDIDIYDKGKWHSIQSEDKLTVRYFFRISLYHQATFISRKLFDKYGMYNEKFKSTGDYEFFIRTLLKNNATYGHIPVTISKFVADGMSNDPEWMPLNMKEREMSWSLNFSTNIMNELNEYEKIVSSEEIKWGRRIKKIFPF